MLVSNTMVIYHGILTLEKVGAAVTYDGIFYSTGQKYHGILTLEKWGTMVNYLGIFITLSPESYKEVEVLLLTKSVWPEN